MFTSCESGAMAQRGEIRCVERQFVLQSVPAVQAGLANRASQAERERVPSRQEKREKFQTDDTLQRKRSCVCLSSCFRLRQFSRPLLGREEELSVSLNRALRLRMARNGYPQHFLSVFEQNHLGRFALAEAKGRSIEVRWRLRRIRVQYADTVPARSVPGRFRAGRGFEKGFLAGQHKGRQKKNTNQLTHSSRFL